MRLEVVQVDAEELMLERLHALDAKGGCSEEDEEDVDPPPESFTMPSDLAITPFDRDFFIPSSEISLEPPAFYLDFGAPSTFQQGVGGSFTNYAGASALGKPLPLSQEPYSLGSQPSLGSCAERQPSRKRKRRPKAKRNKPAPDLLANPASSSPSTTAAPSAGSTTTRPGNSKRQYRKRKRNERRVTADVRRELGMDSEQSDLTASEDLSASDVEPIFGQADPPHRAVPQAKAIARHRCNQVEAVNVDFDMAEDTPVSSVGWSGTRQARHERTYSYKECLGLGVKPIPWNGRDPLALVDKKHKALVYGAGRPKYRAGKQAVVDEDGNAVLDKDGKPTFVDEWDEVAEEAAERVKDGGEKANFSEADSHHRRGAFRVLTRSISYGGGRKEIGNRANTKTNAKVLDDLVESEPIKRIAGFQSHAMLGFAPRLHAYYRYCLQTLLRWYIFLVRNFGNSVFAAITVNFGLQTICYPHIDDANLAWGWCAVTALGHFDFTNGGHLVLWDLMVMIEFPPGSTILLPSALLCHSNTTISPKEERFSLTQYSAAGVFRWLFNGGKSDASFLSTASPQKRAEWEQEKLTRYRNGIAMLPIIKEKRIRKDNKECK